MAAEVIRASDLRARFVIVECAEEDCYLIAEFEGNLRNIYTGLSDADARSAIRAQFRTLVDAGAVRLHRGRQCSYPNRADVALEVSSADFDSIPNDEWRMLCVCDTELTERAYREIGAELGR